MDDQSENNSLIKPNQAIFFIVLLALSIIGYFYTLFDEIAMLKRVYEQGVLLKVRTAVIPLIMMMPALGVLIWGIACRLRNKFSAQNRKQGLFVIIGCFPLFLMSWLNSNFIQRFLVNFMISHKFSIAPMLDLTDIQVYSGI